MVPAVVDGIRSRFTKDCRFCILSESHMMRMAPYPSGKGEVCKTFMNRFDSDRRLNRKDRLWPVFSFKAPDCREIYWTSSPSATGVSKRRMGILLDFPFSVSDCREGCLTSSPSATCVSKRRMGILLDFPFSVSDCREGCLTSSPSATCVSAPLDMGPALAGLFFLGVGPQGNLFDVVAFGRGRKKAAVLRRPLKDGPLLPRRA